MPTLPEISVIVPTPATPARVPGLVRALGSIRAQAGVQPCVVLVLNGTTEPEPPAAVRDALAGMPHEIRHRPEPGLPEAYRLGRTAVRTPWFGSLDDDDELLPGALALRMDAFGREPGCRVVVTNGLRRSPRADTLHVTDADAVRRAPLEALLAGNWLLPGSWTCRTDALTADDLAAMPAYLECTWLALRFASQPGFAFLDEPTVAWHVGDGAHSSRSVAHAAGQPAALAALAREAQPEPFRRAWRARIPGACQDAAERCLETGRIGAALSLQARALAGAPLPRWPALGRRILSSWWHGGRA